MLTQYFGRELPRSQTWRALSGGSFSYGLALVWTTTFHSEGVPPFNEREKCWESECRKPQVAQLRSPRCARLTIRGSLRALPAVACLPRPGWIERPAPFNPTHVG